MEVKVLQNAMLAQNFRFNKLLHTFFCMKAFLSCIYFCRAWVDDYAVYADVLPLHYCL
jgi:hypothetical protein